MPDFIVKFDEPILLNPGDGIRISVPSIGGTGNLPYVWVWNGSVASMVKGVMIPVDSSVPTDHTQPGISSASPEDPVPLEIDP